ncbi:helix-turn-helix domain-containing protein [Streptomyces sp. NPDC059917]|uniref:helix-turn-helix domain-containing protein n=1 Tax=Streptomyces sp. NPDC059917 TaxID=3347002 RepID=UPI003656F5E7
MGNQQLNARSRASSRNAGGSPGYGVIHVNIRHTRRFTVVGNHLAQHPEMSLMGIGLATHIQSLPTGTPVGIKDLAARFPESEYRIARTLRELEQYGYLERTRDRLPGGQVVTRTVFYNRPGYAVPEEDAGREAGPVAVAVEAEAESEPPPVAVATPLRPLPRPAGPASAARRDAAEQVLVRLRGVDPRLLLGQRDVERLAPAVEAWLERGASPDAVTAALTGHLPPRPRNPAGLIGYRLTAQIPPERSGRAGIGTPGASAPPVLPLRSCERCDRAYRAAEPGYCKGCAT